MIWEFLLWILAVSIAIVMLAFAFAMAMLIVIPTLGRPAKDEYKNTEPKFGPPGHE